MTYMLDTNIIIYYFKGMGNVRMRFNQTPYEKLLIPSIVLYELNVGIAKSSSPNKRKMQLTHLLEYVSIIPFTKQEATHSAMVRAKLEMQGTPIGVVDGLIAGVALANDSILVTRNVREFERIPNLPLENWYDN